MLFFSRSYPISSICILVVGNTSYGKRHISRTEPVYGKLNLFDQSLHSPQLFLHRCQVSSMHSSTRKKLQKITIKNITPCSIIDHLENRTSSRATDVV